MDVADWVKLPGHTQDWGWPGLRSFDHGRFLDWVPQA